MKFRTYQFTALEFMKPVLFTAIDVCVGLYFKVFFLWCHTSLTHPNVTVDFDRIFDATGIGVNPVETVGKVRINLCQMSARSRWKFA